MKETNYTYNLILFVDDEEKTRKYFTRLFGDKFKIICAEDGDKALEVFKKYKENFGVVVSDQRMPNMIGSELLEKIAKLKPSTVRILSTAYSDLDAAADAVNKGGIYKYVTKPWKVNEFEVTLMRAMELYILKKERDDLLRQKLSSVQTLAYADRILSIATLAVFQHEGLKNINSALKIFAQLNEACEEHLGDQMENTNQLGWQELYENHTRFLKAIRDGMKSEKLQGETLDYSKNVPIKDVVMPLTDKLKNFQWQDGEASTTHWPGPEKAIQAEITSLLSALDNLDIAGDTIPISEVQGGIELCLPTKSLAKTIKPFLSGIEEDTSQGSLALLAGFFRLAHAGANFELFPEAGGIMLRLRVLLDIKKSNNDMESGWDSLVNALIGNELFWSRIDK